MPTRPGSTLEPFESMTRAPFGGGAEEGWTAAILPWSMTSVSSSCGAAPVPSITRTCVSAMIPVGAATNGATYFPGGTGGGSTRASKPAALAEVASSTAKRVARLRIISSPTVLLGTSHRAEEAVTG